MDYDVMDFIQPRTKRLIGLYKNTDGARKFIKQRFLQKENLERAQFPWEKLLFCGFSFRTVNVKVADNNGTASNDDPEYLIGVRFMLDIEIADSMMELREARKLFDQDSTDAMDSSTSIVHIDPDKYKAVEQQLINEARNGRVN